MLYRNIFFLNIIHNLFISHCIIRHIRHNNLFYLNLLQNIIAATYMIGIRVCQDQIVKLVYALLIQIIHHIFSFMVIPSIDHCIMTFCLNNCTVTLSYIEIGHFHLTGRNRICNVLCRLTRHSFHQIPTLRKSANQCKNQHDCRRNSF